MKRKISTRIMECDICTTNNPNNRNLPIYVNGSEGLIICHSCEMNLVSYINGLQSVINRSEKETYKKKRRKANDLLNKLKGGQNEAQNIDHN